MSSALSHFDPYLVARRANRSIAQAKHVSIALVVTALYGDLVKRLLPSTLALVFLYVVALAIIAFIAFSRYGKRSRNRPLISTLAGILMICYGLQFVTRFDVDILPAMQSLFYMCIPLAFIFIIPRVYPQFDVYSLTLYTTIFMMPVHAVGLVQHFFDQSFLISTAYAETGGVIARNFLDETGSFNRMPSIFASADRYAGVSAVQILFYSLLLSAPSIGGRLTKVLVFIGLLMAFAGIMIAGARSRALIVGAALCLGFVAFIFNATRARVTAPNRKFLARTVALMSVLLGAALFFDGLRESISKIPILLMLEQTSDKSDVLVRLFSALEVSLMPSDVTLFGEGLGVSGGGRPGEFAIRAMWIEGGIFWTFIFITIYVCMLIIWVWSALREIASGNVALSILLAGCVMFWLFGLLAGFSSLFELSVALLFFPMMAVISTRSGRKRIIDECMNRQG